jgi:hypothetical protein
MNVVTLKLAQKYYDERDGERQALYDEIRQAYESGELKGEPGTTTWAGITDKPSTFPPSAHEHSPGEVGLGNVQNVQQMPLSGGTFTGQAIAQANTGYTVGQLRNIRLFADGEAVPTLANGEIALIYEV